MSATLEPLNAAEIYSSLLEPRARSKARRVLVSALDLWCATTGGRMELTRAGDIVVRRRSDGVEELRVPVPAADDAPVLLDVLREQLQSLSPDEFRAAWGIE